LGKATLNQLRTVIIANVILVFLYGFVNWAEYSIINVNSHLNDVTIQTYFPFYILVTRFTVGFRSVLFVNYPLIIFTTATILNLYFIIRLQRGKEVPK
jgi:hypothetical protein